MSHTDTSLCGRRLLQSSKIFVFASFYSTYVCRDPLETGLPLWRYVRLESSLGLDQHEHVSGDVIRLKTLRTVNVGGEPSILFITVFCSLSE